MKSLLAILLPAGCVQGMSAQSKKLFLGSNILTKETDE